MSRENCRSRSDSKCITSAYYNIRFMSTRKIYDVVLNDNTETIDIYHTITIKTPLMTDDDRYFVYPL